MGRIIHNPRYEKKRYYVEVGTITPVIIKNKMLLLYFTFISLSLYYVFYIIAIILYYIVYFVVSLLIVFRNISCSSTCKALKGNDIGAL